MSSVRRSARLKSRPSEHADGENDSIKNVPSKYIESDDSSEAESEEESEDDEYREETRRGGAKRARSRNTKSKQLAKRSKTNTKKKNKNSASISNLKADQEQYLELTKDFEPTEIFDILSTAEDVSIDDLLREYLETYRSNRDEFMQTFINLILNCCGAMTHVEKHDIHSNESSGDTILEVQLAFQRQKLHEFHLIMSKDYKKKARFQPLYNNFVEFMYKFCEIAEDVQLLFIESFYNDNNDDSEYPLSPLVTDLLTWLSAFSVSKIRCFRYVSTLVLYLFEDYLTKYSVDLERDYLAKLTKQLTTEEKKKRPNKTTISKLANSIEEIRGNKIQTEIIIDNLAKLTFIHRFKDVDDSIRGISIEHLTTWIKNYPEKFLKVTYLKYYGWLLSDDSSLVRSQVLRSLPSIISRPKGKSTENIAMRQFYDRFKQVLLDISLKDVDVEIRLLAVNVLVEISSLGYLDNLEILTISSLIFDDKDVKISSHSKSSRFLSSVAKFLANIIKEKVKDTTQNQSIPDMIADVPGESFLKIGYFMRLLSNSLSFYLREKENVTNSEKVHTLFQAAEFLFPYFGSNLSNICKLLIIDHDSNDVLSNLDIFEEEQNTSHDKDDYSNLSKLPLLPNDRNNTILYVTVLNGLCQGGHSSKNSNKSTISKSVLPYLYKLIITLPLQSIDILGPILRMLEIFNYEEWIESGCENDLKKIVEIVGKTFKENPLSNSVNDLAYESYGLAIEKMVQFQSTTIDEYWENTMSLIKMEMSKFLDEYLGTTSQLDAASFNDTALSLYENYVNKITLLGKSYPLNIESDLVEKFLTLFVSRVTKYSEDFTNEFIKSIDLKILGLFTSWHINNWTNIISDQNTDINENQVPEQTLNCIVHTIFVVGNLLTSLESEFPNNDDMANTMYFKWSISNTYIDIILSLKMFELNIPVDKVNWRRAITNHLPIALNESLNNVLLEVFLFLESLYANSYELRLERLDDENVNFNDTTGIEPFENNEKQLLLYTIKLKALMKLDLLNSKLVTRIGLNKELIGPLFIKVIDNTIFENQEVISEHKHVKESASNNNEVLEYNHQDGGQENVTESNGFPEMIEQSSEI
ncbi:Cohesin subunit SCC3 [Nakaseomyces bracarensis]|uniref:Cohesin subunit SCC3 n=1 Tax=Nakaseomyces bracarensis TaxID=273131 RepID=A0ABR4NX29_9SACH